MKKRPRRGAHRTEPPPAGGCVRVNGQIGRLIGGRDGHFLGAYLSYSRDGRFVSNAAERRLLVGTAKPMRPTDRTPAADQLPSDAQMEALAIEHGLNGHRRKAE